MEIIYKNTNEIDEILEIDNKILNVLKECTNYDDINFYNPLYKDMVLYLSEYRENVLNWYDFNTDSTILQIGTNFGNIIELLHKNSKYLFSIEPSRKKAEYIYEKYKELENTSVLVGTLSEIDFDEKFDYIILNNSLEFASMYINHENSAEKLIEYAKKYLKQDGKIIIITNNKFAIKYFIGASDLYNKEPYSNIIGDNNYTNNKYKLFGKNEIIEMIEKVGINKFKFFYALPENKAINVIFTDEFLPTKETMNKYLPIYNNYDFIRFSEIKAMKQFLLNGTFSLFCNSYVIECSLNDNINNSKFISFNKRKLAAFGVLLGLLTVGVNYVNEQENVSIGVSDEFFNEDGLGVIDIKVDDGVIPVMCNNSEIEELLDEVHCFDGESLDVLAEQYGTTVTTLLDLNGDLIQYDNGNYYVYGDEIIVPNGESVEKKLIKNYR